MMKTLSSVGFLLAVAACFVAMACYSADLPWRGIAWGAAWLFAGVSCVSALASRPPSKYVPDELDWVPTNQFFLKPEKPAEPTTPTEPAVEPAPASGGGAA